MILFVFEGRIREPAIFRTLETLFFNNRVDKIVCSLCNNIYELYRQLQALDGDGDFVSIVRESYENRREDNPFDKGAKSSDFSEIYLFFDYDFQNANYQPDELDEIVKKMLATFDNETDNGKLFISYPMVEAVRYTKKLPDADYYTYEVPRGLCRNTGFKSLCHAFSDYKNLDFLLLDARKQDEKGNFRKNWCFISLQNVKKANYICNGTNEIPSDKNKVSQKKIFDSQIQKYVKPNDSVAILSAFPLFLFDYFKSSSDIFNLH